LYRFLAIAVSWMSKTYLKSDHFNGGGSIKREERKAARVRREQRALEEKGSIALPHLTLPRSIKWELSRQRRLMAAANDNDAGLDICVTCGDLAPFPYRDEWYCEACIDNADKAALGESYGYLLGFILNGREVSPPRYRRLR